MTTIVIADDHPVVRQGLCMLLGMEKDFKVIGEAGNGVEAIRLVETAKPNVLIVDLNMPDLNGLEVIRQVHQRSPQTRVIVLSMHADEAYILEALQHGAVGYVLKESNTNELVQAVHDIMAGRRYLSPPLSQRAIEAYSQKKKPIQQDLYETLTAREREVLHLVAENYTSQEIASRLFISPRTVELHRATLMRKLGLHKQAELIRYALQRGIIPVNMDLRKNEPPKDNTKKSPH